MKKLVFLFCMISSVAFADVVSIDGRTYDAEVLKVSKNRVKVAMNNDVYNVPISAIDFIWLEESNSSFEGISAELSDVLPEMDPCLAGTMDAKNRGKMAANFVGGMFFGPFALIHKFIKDFHPAKDFTTIAMSGHQDMIKDFKYVECYRKQARTKALTEAGAGWATWIILVLTSQG